MFFGTAKIELGCLDDGNILPTSYFHIAALHFYRWIFIDIVILERYCINIRRPVLCEYFFSIFHRISGDKIKENHLESALDSQVIIVFFFAVLMGTWWNHSLISNNFFCTQFQSRHYLTSDFALDLVTALPVTLIISMVAPSMTNNLGSGWYHLAYAVKLIRFCSFFNVLKTAEMVFGVSWDALKKIIFIFMIFFVN